MRGVLALAAALSLPKQLADGSPFPERNLIIFLTFSVILVTLVFQGLTLPPLIRLLGMAGKGRTDSEEKQARRTMLEAALHYIKSRRSEEDSHHLAAAYTQAATRYKRRLAAITGEGYAPLGIDSDDHAHVVTLARQLIRVERDTVLRLRNEGQINNQVLRQL